MVLSSCMLSSWILKTSSLRSYPHGYVWCTCTKCLTTWSLLCSQHKTCDDVENILTITNLTLINCFCLKFTNSLRRFVPVKVKIRTLLSRSMKELSIIGLCWYNGMMRWCWCRWCILLTNVRVGWGYEWRCMSSISLVCRMYYDMAMFSLTYRRLRSREN